MNIELKTPRLIMEVVSEKYLHDLVQLNLDPEVREFIPGEIQDAEQTTLRMLDFIAKSVNSDFPRFVILDKQSKAFVGCGGFTLLESNEVEVGYVICKNNWHQGYATEALSAMLNWAKNNTWYPYLIAFAPVSHLASQRVMEKCGMIYFKTELSQGVEGKFYKAEC